MFRHVCSGSSERCSYSCSHLILVVGSQHVPVPIVLTSATAGRNPRAPSSDGYLLMLVQPPLSRVLHSNRRRQASTLERCCTGIFSIFRRILVVGITPQIPHSKPAVLEHFCKSRALFRALFCSPYQPDEAFAYAACNTGAIARGARRYYQSL